MYTDIKTRWPCPYEVYKRTRPLFMFSLIEKWPHIGIFLEPTSSPHQPKTPENATVEDLSIRPLAAFLQAFAVG